jgi:hypothetical protein
MYIIDGLNLAVSIVHPLARISSPEYRVETVHAALVEVPIIPRQKNGQLILDVMKVVARNYAIISS